MSRRRRFTTLALLLLLAVALALSALVYRPCWYICRANFERIEEGMTPDEVEAVIGLPPGDYTVLRHLAPLDATGPEFLYADLNLQSQWWASDAGFVLVFFRDGKAARREFADGANAPGRDFLDVLGRLVPGDREYRG